MHQTEEQIIALAPDASSAKAGKELAKPARWSNAGKSARAIWGECQGSGALPYRTQIDLRDNAFKCTCPSRKFPCKHGLGLLLLYAAKPVFFKQVEEAGWVQEWLDKRIVTVQTKAETPKDSAAENKAQQKRTEARIAKVEAGIEEIELWLKDLIRNGLITAPDKSPAFWQAAASRMIDAQAPGLERMVRNLGEINYFSEDWQNQALVHICRLYLVTQAYKHMHKLPETIEQDIRSLIGWTQKTDELKVSPGVRDHWLVLGRQIEQDRDITVQKNWLIGINSGQFALILNFAHRTQTIDISLVPGTAMEAELVFYPGSVPLRALLKERIRTVAFTQVSGFANWQTVMQEYARQAALYPWISQWPVIVENVALLPLGKQWILQDEAKRIAPTDKRFAKIWKLLAYSGGHPQSMFLLYENGHFLPMGFWQENQYVIL